jgi:DNA polymerase-3 subunit alpha
LIRAGAFDGLHLNRAALLASVERAFEFAAASQANANQGGLFDMMGEDAHGSSTQEPDLIDQLPWGVKERLTHEKVALGFYLSGHLFDESEAEVRRFARTRIEDLMDAREPQLVAGIISDLRTINGQRGKLAILKLEDKSGVIEATADEKLINQHRHLLKDDELVIVMGRVQPDRFSGGLRLNINQVWDLPQARCRFGKYLRVTVNGHSPDLSRLLQDFAPVVETSEEGDFVRGVGVRLKLLREGAQAEIALGERVRFYPSDAALASWTAQAHEGQAQMIYE